MQIPKRLPKSLKGLDSMIDYIAKFHNTKNLTILEVGSWTGSSAEVFAKRFKSVLCVDPWESTKNTISAKYNMRKVEKEFNEIEKKYSNIHKLRHRIEDIIHIFENKSIDVIYIDGEHTYNVVKRDIGLCLPKCKFFLCGHDYWKGRFDSVIKAVDEFKKPDKIFSDTSWLIKL